MASYFSFLKKKKDNKNEKTPQKIEPSPDFLNTLSFPTRAIHADQGVEKNNKDIAPPLHLTSTFERPNEDGLVYGRIEAMNRKRCEAVLGELEGGTAYLYSSGIAAVISVLYLTHPRRIFIEKGYHMTHGAIHLFGEQFGDDGIPNGNIETIEISKRNEKPFQKGDLVFVESPNNPAAEMLDIAEICKEAHAVGAIVCVDSTFATPVLQKPLELGADVVLHSCTKFLGGHSDLLAGALITKNQGFIVKLSRQRGYLGNIPGNLECWLLLRSLRTLDLRVKRQSKTAEKFANWLATQSKVKKVWHPSLPSHPGHEIAKKQMKGPPACFSFEMNTVEQASLLTSKLKLFKNATSLGGVESLIDYRYAFDSSVSPLLFRISIGLESTKDLIADMANAFSQIPENNETK